MKRICAAGVLGTLLGLYSSVCSAQDYGGGPSTITPYEIAVGYHQTTNLIFPYTLKSVDIGSNAVLAQKAKGVENILQIKAGTEQFMPTNISVVTADGKFYSFVLSYTEKPTDLNISFAGSRPIKLSGDLPNQRELNREAWSVAGKRSFLKVQKDEQALRLQLNGIFNSEKNLWMKFSINNHSQVDFRVGSMRFFLRDKKRMKRTALNETEIVPIYKPDLLNVKGPATAVWAIGFKPFVVPKHQRLIVQVADESGGRIISLPIKTSFFLRAHKLR